MKVVISLSGGLDSAVLLKQLIHEGETVVRAVQFGYGSKHGDYELMSAWSVAGHSDVPIQRIDLTDVFKTFKSALLKGGSAIPDGHYEEESMRQTVVPFRNGIFISVLAGIAESLGADFVAIGAHAGDHSIYPDCRPDFLDYMNAAVKRGTTNRVQLLYPFEHMNKAEIVQRGFDLKVPFALTRTCYKNQPTACGKCGACQERLAAFRVVAKGHDPIIYECRDIVAKAT